MCLNKSHLIPKISNGNVYCTKVCDKLHGKFYTLCQNCEWKFSSPQIPKGGLLKFILSFHIYGAGVHAMQKIIPASKFIKQNGRYLILCKVPKGTMYYIGKDGDIASRKLEYVDCVEYSDVNFMSKTYSWSRKYGV